MCITGTDGKRSRRYGLAERQFRQHRERYRGRTAVFENIRKFLTYILAHNVPELITYLGFALFTIPLPLTPIQVLSIDMATDSLTALGLGSEKPYPLVMQRPPRPQSERLFNGAWRYVLTCARPYRSCSSLLLKKAGNTVIIWLCMIHFTYKPPPPV